MKKFKIKNIGQMPDRARVVSRCVSTVDGLESVHVNMDTGEITYGADACVDEALMCEAFKKEGLDVEETD